MLEIIVIGLELFGLGEPIVASKYGTHQVIFGNSWYLPFEFSRYSKENGLHRVVDLSLWHELLGCAVGCP